MAEYQFFSETELDENSHQFQIEVTADLGDGDVQKHLRDVVFEPDSAHEKAQEYADELEAELKKQKAESAE